MKLFKNHSRVLAMLMALVMCVGLCQPAFALGNQDEWCAVCQKTKTKAQCGGSYCVDSSNGWAIHITQGTRCVDVKNGGDGTSDVHDHQCDYCHGWMESSIDLVVEEEATCTVPGRGHYECSTPGCSKNNSPATIPALNHNYTSWSDNNQGENVKEGTHTKTCRNPEKVCDAHTVTEAHTYGAPTENTDENGQTTLTWTCTDCDHPYTEIEQPPHVCAGEYKVQTPATCTTAVVEQQWCSVCQDYFGEIRTGDALGHEWKGIISWEDTNPGENTSDGNHTATCTRCNGSEKDGKETKTERHAYGDPVVTRNGNQVTRTYTCTANGCGHTYTETSDCEHTNNELVVVQPATCTEPAMVQRRCLDCGETYGPAMPSGNALGHDYANGTIRVVDAADHEHVCGRCGYSYTEAHSFGEWSEWVDDVRTRTCTHCGYGQLDYRYDEPVVDDTPVDPVAPVAPVTPAPAPAEDEEIEDNDTPLTDAPEVVEPVEDAKEPAVEPAADEEDISDNETPMTDAPEAVEPAEEPAEVDLADNDVPMADVPKTSDLSLVWYAATAISALGLTVLGRKKEENDD